MSLAVTNTAKLEVKGRIIISAYNIQLDIPIRYWSCTSHPSNTYCNGEKHQLGPVFLQIFLEDEAGAETPDHVTEEAK